MRRIDIEVLFPAPVIDCCRGSGQRRGHQSRELISIHTRQLGKRASNMVFILKGAKYGKSFANHFFGGSASFYLVRLLRIF